MTTRRKTCLVVIRTLATHVSLTDSLVYSLSLLELVRVVLWAKPLGMSSAFYLVAVPWPREEFSRSSKLAVVSYRTFPDTDVFPDGVEKRKGLITNFGPFVLNMVTGYF